MPVLVEAMRVAWPEVKSSKNVVPWGIDEFCNRAMSYELLHFADSYPESAVPNPALLERIGFYSEIDIHQLSNYLAHLTGRGAKQWTLSDFALSSPKSRVEGDLDDEEPSEEQAIHTSGELNLYHLTVEFLGYLRRIEGVSYSKGELGRRELHQFLAERHKKKPEHRESMFESMMREEERRRGRRSPPKQKYSGYENILVPDRERLDQYIAGLLGMLNQLYYRASALFEIIPAWLGFLEAKRLIDDEVRVRTINDLSPLARDLKQAFSRYADDPGPHQALDGWPFCKSGFEL
jgi:hypothetical protein